MDEQNIPIDINSNKLLDWLVSRRHVGKDWQNCVLKIREKISNAIQDMPAHDGIAKLLSGQHINYFHCLKIVEILKETEKDSKNIFGRYGSQRMKDWQDIISAYQRDNVYLAETAQILTRNVSFEIPSLKRQIIKLEQTQAEYEKKIKENTKTEASMLKEFTMSCDQLGIQGKDIKNELIGMLKALPQILQESSEKVKIVKPAVELYAEFCQFLSGQEAVSNPGILPVLRYLVESGNTTTYEYVFGEKPIRIEEPEQSVIALQLNDDGNKIDFGEGEQKIDFGSDQIDFGEQDNQQTIDWGSSNEESFEIVSYDDVDINLQESGIEVEVSGLDGGIARGEDALSILDNPKTRDQVINNLIELEAFLKMRLYEMSNESDLLSFSQMQDVSSVIQMQTIASITQLHDCVSIALGDLTSKRLQHLHNLKHSPKYLDILSASLKQKLSVVERMKNNKILLEKKIRQTSDEIRKIEPVIKLMVVKTKELQKEIEQDISKKYKGRVVNIVGGVNLL
ncbi:CDK5 regulatory subunit-associated protein 3 [Cylas formicarius]|uniref:CDK5 regulatory subunit-associated protein 3 n=1 Tax=Cylas formicarius TaxID=197179 RepID=UPI002958C0FC|nr:CDK5 regulatory subunit-associated protein 3 [Cylas formicarius]